MWKELVYEHIMWLALVLTVLNLWSHHESVKGDVPVHKHSGEKL
jgi:hypothetical protein